MSTTKRFFRLVHADARRNAAKACHEAPDGFGVTIAPIKRSLDQNALFHALCDDIARSGVQWAGKRRDASEWKILLVSGHAVATKADCEIVPGLENELVAIRESTAAMSRARGSSLLEYTLAFCAEQGIAVRGRAG